LYGNPFKKEFFEAWFLHVIVLLLVDLLFHRPRSLIWVLLHLIATGDLWVEYDLQALDYKFEAIIQLEILALAAICAVLHCSFIISNWHKV
jgi:hypothetical protein